MQDLSKKEIYSRLNEDFNFLVRFILDNNYNAVVQNIKASNLKPVLPVNYDKKFVLDLIYTNLATGNEKTVLKCLDVPYNASADNYTSGLGDYFIPNVPTKSDETEEVSTAEKGGFWGMLVGTVASALPSIIGAFTGNTPPPPPPPADTKKNNTPYIIGGVVLVAVVVLVLVFRRKK
jgi:LPXTG-motif cell wall-anchored protein